MSALRQKMIDDMQLRGFAERTQEAYLSAVRQLAKHYRKSPDQIDEEELRQYFLFLKNEKHAARNTCTIALCGIKFFFQHTLGKEWKTFDFLRPPREKKLPVVLSVEEVSQVLKRVRLYHYRVCLTTIYACGLRLLEGTRLQVSECCTFITPKATKTVMCRSPMPAWRCYATIGAFIAIRSGFSPPSVRARNLCKRAACKKPYAPL